MLIKGLFSLPYRVLVTFLPLPIAFFVFLTLFPSVGFFLVLVFLFITLVGGAVVAIEANLERTHSHQWLLETGIPKVYLFSFLIPLFIFGTIGASDLYFRDAGELGMASFYLGVAHPTGFPFFLLVSKGLSLLPFGSVFFRQNSLSFVSMALCIGIATLLARRWCTNPKVLWLFLPLFALSSALVWSQGCATEVYAISCLWLLMNVAVFQEAYLYDSLRLFVLGFFLLGLGFSLHITAPFEASVFAIPLFFRFLKRSKSLRLRALLLALFAVLFGLLSTTYMLVLASKDMPVAFWHVSNLDDFFKHIFAQRIFTSFQHEIGVPSWLHLVQRARDFLSLVKDPLLLFVVFFLAGLVAIFKRDRWVATAFAMTIIADILFAIVINPMGIRENQTNLAFSIFLAILCGVGVEELAGLFQSKKARTLFFGLSGMLLVSRISLAGMFFSDESPRPIAEDLLMSVPSGAVVFTSSDDLSASLGALQGVEGQRPDVFSFVLGFVQDREYLGRQIAWHCVGPDCDEMKRELEEAFDRKPLSSGILGISRRRSVFVEPGYGEVDRVLRSYSSPSFPAYEVLNAPSEESKFQKRARTAMDSALRYTFDGDGLTMSYCASFLRTLGVHLYELGFFDDAVVMTTKALKLAPDDIKARYNLGEIMCARGMQDEGSALLRQVLDKDLTNERARKALERCR